MNTPQPQPFVERRTSLWRELVDVVYGQMAAADAAEAEELRTNRAPVVNKPAAVSSSRS